MLAVNFEHHILDDRQVIPDHATNGWPSILSARITWDDSARRVRFVLTEKASTGTALEMS